MKHNTGPSAVRQHADREGLTAGISAIVRAFGKDAIKDIEIHSEGEVSYIHELSPNRARVIPGTKSDQSVKDIIKADKEAKPTWRR